MYGVALLAVASLVAAVRSQAADVKGKEEAVGKDLQEFKGTWRMSSKEVDGKKLREEEIKDLVLTHDGSGNCSVRRLEKLIAEATIKLDPTKTPKTIEIAFTEGERKGQTVVGIYELEGDAFRVCIARPGDERPAEFSTSAGSGRTLVLFNRKRK
jgi:uncharacterized protein (TIGR03067 family)